MVSFVMKDFYKKKLQPTCVCEKEVEQTLTLCAVNKVEIPYLDCLEVTIEVDVSSCGMQVLEDTSATTKERQDVPGLLGTIEGCTGADSPVWFPAPTTV